MDRINQCDMIQQVRLKTRRSFVGMGHAMLGLFTSLVIQTLISQNETKTVYNLLKSYNEKDFYTIIFKK